VGSTKQIIKKGADMNIIAITGRLTADAVIRFVGEKRVANFSLAHNEKWKDKSSEWRERVSFFGVSQFGISEKLANNLVKGQEILIEGKLVQETYNDKKTGNEVKQVKIQAARIQLMNKAKESAPAQPQFSDAGEEFEMIKDDERSGEPDGIPF